MWHRASPVDCHMQFAAVVGPGGKGSVNETTPEKLRKVLDFSYSFRFLHQVMLFSRLFWCQENSGVAIWASAVCNYTMAVKRRFRDKVP